MPSLLAWWHRLYRRLQRWITPGLEHAQYVYIDTLRRLAPQGPLWLDAGCGRGLLPEWLRSMESSILKPGHRIVGIDADLASLLDNHTVTWRIAGNLRQAPFRPASFAFISANMVMEHVDTPATALRQIADLLPPGGVFVFHTPNYWNYQIFLASCLPQHWKNRLVGWLEGRLEEDVFPTFYRLNTPPVVRQLAAATGFSVRELHLVSSIPETIRLGPVVIIELLLIRLFSYRPFQNLRSNMIVVLERLPQCGVVR